MSQCPGCHLFLVRASLSRPQKYLQKAIAIVTERSALQAMHLVVSLPRSRCPFAGERLLDSEVIEPEGCPHAGGIHRWLLRVQAPPPSPGGRRTISVASQDHNPSREGGSQMGVSCTPTYFRPTVEEALREEGGVPRAQVGSGTPNPVRTDSSEGTYICSCTASHPWRL